MKNNLKYALALGAVTLVSSTGLVIACSSSTPATPAADAAAADGATTDAASGADTGVVPVGTLTVNEISGKGDEWVEIINNGVSPIDVSGYTITDGDHDGGAPNKGNSAKIVTGTTISPGGYLIAMGYPDGGPCTAPVGVPCVVGQFAISGSQGDIVYLLNPANGVVVKVVYPANTVTSGHSWGRLPNGTGNFQIATKTKGAENKP